MYSFTFDIYGLHGGRAPLGTMADFHIYRHFKLPCLLKFPFEIGYTGRLLPGIYQDIEPVFLIGGNKIKP
jgi:hypothetical protein